MNSLEIAQADLQSSMQSLLESHKRLRSRIGMQELRGRRTAGEDDGAAPPPGARKQALRDFYLRGQSPVEIARRVMQENEQ